jgi:hypothetical protein
MRRLLILQVTMHTTSGPNAELGRLTVLESKFDSPKWAVFHNPNNLQSGNITKLVDTHRVFLLHRQ